MNKIYNVDCIYGMSQMDKDSIDCCVTSPPYFGLRDYGTAEQIGLEETPELFVEKLVQVFTEVKRILKPEGTLWLNLGDSYSGSGKGPAGNLQYNENGQISQSSGKTYGLKPKDLIGIPWMVAFALRSSGWYLRQDIIWAKPNPMPESVTDRCTKSHEYIFLMSKNKKYYYDADAIKEKAVTVEDRPSGVARNRLYDYDSKENNNPKAYRKREKQNGESAVDTKLRGHSGCCGVESDFRNKRSVWTVTTKSFSGAHFATFPEDLIVDCIKAGCPENGIVLDPFMGAGTTGLVAKKLNRNYIGFELNPEYIKIAEKRIFNEIGLFA